MDKSFPFLSYYRFNEKSIEYTQPDNVELDKPCYFSIIPCTHKTYPIQIQPEAYIFVPWPIIYSDYVLQWAHRKMAYEVTMRYTPSYYRPWGQSW